jgi:mono/diheme cytochrome c family protein
MNDIRKTGLQSGGRRVARAAAVLGIALAAILIAHPRGLTASARAAAAAKTTNDGIYTAEQAKRGNALYGQSCANCHMDDLSGSGQAPPLAGDVFMANWEGRSLGDLFDITRSTMPLNQPGSMSTQEYVDVVMYMLQANGYPTGSDELKDPDAMKNIVIAKKSK